MKIKVVNDSKEIAVIVYFTTLTIMESLVLGLLVSTQPCIYNFEYRTDHDSCYCNNWSNVCTKGINITFIANCIYTCVYFVADDIFVERSERREGVHHQREVVELVTKPKYPNWRKKYCSVFNYIGKRNSPILLPTAIFNLDNNIGT